MFLSVLVRLSLLKTRLVPLPVLLPLLVGVGLLMLVTPWYTHMFLSETLVTREDELKLSLLGVDEDLGVLRRGLVQDVCSIYYEHTNLSLTPGFLQTLFLKNILVDDSRKLLYCMVPKVACTNWIRVLGITSDNVSVYRLKKMFVNPDLNMANVNHQTVWPKEMVRKYIESFPQVNLHTPNYNRAVGLNTLNQYTPEGVIHRIKTYYKFMFVRHPLERLLSAFRDKFEKDYDKPFHEYFGKEIIKTYRTNPTAEDLETGSSVKFGEFVKFVLDRDKIK